MKQWTVRCSQQIKEIYDNLPNKGNSFLQERLNSVYEEVRHKRVGDLSNFQNLRLRLKPETPKEKAKCQINFKPTKENAQKIEYLKGKLGLTDSELFEVLVLWGTPSETSFIEPSVKVEKEEPSKIETQLEKVDEEPSRVKFNINEWKERRDQVCLDCEAEPYLKKEFWYIVCSRPREWGETKGGKLYPKSLWEEIRIEQCQRTLNYLISKKTEDQAQKEKETEDQTQYIEELEHKLEEDQKDLQIQRLRERIKELEPFESELFIEREKKRLSKRIDTMIASNMDKEFRCSLDPKTTFSKCSKFCGRYANCKERISHEPYVIALGFIEKDLKRKYCPELERLVTEQVCLFECQEKDHEKWVVCQEIKQDPEYLREAMQKIKESYLEDRFHSQLIAQPSPLEEAIKRVMQRAEEMAKEDLN